MIHSMEDRLFESAAACDQAVADELMAVFRREYAVPTAVALSGGRTPLPVYQRIMDAGCAAGRNLYILFADERMVPSDSPDSNYGNTRPLLEALCVPAERVLRVHTELSLEDAAARYHQELDDFLAQGVVAMAVLGLGMDGHTCSIFTREAARLKERWAFPVQEHAGFARVSVTADLLAEARRIIIHVTGEEKLPVIEQLLRAPEQLPAGAALLNGGRSLAHVEVFRGSVCAAG
ncbi:MAG: hypothetical protein EOM20_01475 [Spartobacteria bacterium]|nr:hypothetical protein [Spartobacteria bacterium]